MSEVTGLNINHRRLAFTFNGNRHELSLGDVRNCGGHTIDMRFTLKPYIRKTKDILIVRKNPEISHWWLNTIKETALNFHVSSQPKEPFLGSKTYFSKFDIELGFNILNILDGTAKEKIDKYIKLISYLNQRAYRDYVCLHYSFRGDGVIETCGIGNTSEKDTHTEEELNGWL